MKVFKSPLRYPLSVWLPVVLGVITLLGFTGYELNRRLVVKDIQLELQKESIWEGNIEEIQSLLTEKLKIFVGKKIWMVSLKEVVRMVHSEPRIGSVQALRVFPNKILVKIQPRKPLLVLLNPETGKIHPLSMEGQILPPLSVKWVPDLPILRGSVFVNNKSVRQKALQFLTLLPEQGEFSRKEISEVKYSPTEKNLIFILSKNGKPIKAGREPARIKIKRIESVLRYLNQKNIQWRVIDARFSQKVVVSTGKSL